MSEVDRWRLQAPNQSFWVNNESANHPAVYMNYKHNASNNADLVGIFSGKEGCKMSDIGIKEMLAYVTENKNH